MSLRSGIQESAMSLHTFFLFNPTPGQLAGHIAQVLVLLILGMVGPTCANPGVKQPALSSVKAGAQPLPIDRQRDHIRGEADAPFSLIEYSDINCPYCRRFHPTAKRLVKDSAGQVNWVYRHFPLVAHKPEAQQLAEAAECVAELGGNASFWRFIDITVMQPKRKATIAASSPNQLPIPVARAAKTVQIDTSALTDCLQSGRHRAKVLADENNALQMHLLGTPANIIIDNQTGEWLVRQGAASLPTLKADIAKLSTRSSSHD